MWTPPDFDLVRVVLSSFVLLCGLFLLIKGITLDSDREWERRVQRLQLQGRTAQRNAEWEHLIKQSRITQIFAGCLIILSGVWFLWPSFIFTLFGW